MKLMNCENCPFEDKKHTRHFCRSNCPDYEKKWKPKFKPGSTSLTKLASWYYPNLKDKWYRNKLLKKRLVKAGVYKYLSVKKRHRKLHGLNALSLRDIVVITRQIGDPPPQMKTWEPENSEEQELPL